MGEEVDYASEAQIKKLYAVLHSLNIEPKDWKKEQGIKSYAKIESEKCSEYIEELEQLEEEKKGRFENDIKNGVQKQIAPAGDIVEITKHLGEIMRLSAREANAIVNEEIDTCGAESTAALIKQKIGVTIFMEAIKRGL